MMLSCEVAILFFCLIFQTCRGQSADPKVICEEAQENCRSCILAHPLCTWCSQSGNQTTSGAISTRCTVLEENEKECPQFIENPTNRISDIKNKPFSDPDTEGNVTQLRPQAIKLTLRQGHPQIVNFTFRRVTDYPLDLYYVMDLSYSMKDDLQTLQNLGSSLFEEINDLTNNVRLGFGTFVDKVMLPYASTLPDQLEDPCSNNEDDQCAAVFGFRHQLPITSNGTAFMNAVNSTKISGNIDSPEGGFDALMQIAVCQNQIKWRDASLRVILFTSDASPHIAMDGKLASILEINDMKCHLEKGVNPYYPNSIVYANSKIMDYPSVGQLKKVFNEQKIQPVFAVTREVFPLYDKLRGLLEPAYADILKNDSSNVLTLISTSYNKIRSNVQLNKPTPPDNVAVQYRVLCPGSNSFQEDSLECNNVSIGDEVTFQFNFTSRGCPDDVRSDVMQINSNSIQDVVSVQFEYICDCKCAADVVRSSPECSNKGSLECGVCACDEGALGLHCQCTDSNSDVPLEQNCTAAKYSGQPGEELCNSAGFCECGICECDEGYWGDYCECKNTGCAVDDQGRICGGPEQGSCENCNNLPVCRCKGKWTRRGPDGPCVCNDDKCRQPSTGNDTESEICQGHGTCDCDRCDCDDYHDGRFCQNCIHPQCVPYQGVCADTTIKTCAECVYNADRLNQEIVAGCADVCENEGIKFETVFQIPDCNACLDNSLAEICPRCDDFSTDETVHIPITCESNPVSNCILQYKIVWNTVQKQYLVFVKNFEQSDCPEINPLTIVLPVVGGILLVGIIALIIWKIIQTIRDKHEYQRFAMETANPNWAAGKSGLYINPKNRIANPMFVGN